jgi:type I restriction enzyme S subunit
MAKINDKNKMLESISKRQKMIEKMSISPLVSLAKSLSVLQASQTQLIQSMVKSFTKIDYSPMLNRIVAFQISQYPSVQSIVDNLFRIDFSPLYKSVALTQNNYAKTIENILVSFNKFDFSMLASTISTSFEDFDFEELKIENFDQENWEEAAATIQELINVPEIQSSQQKLASWFEKVKRKNPVVIFIIAFFLSTYFQVTLTPAIDSFNEHVVEIGKDIIKEVKKCVPKLRFQGFTNAWEQRKLGEVAEIIGGGTPSTSVKEFWNGDIDWYSPVEIGDKVYVNGSQKKITELGFQKSSAQMLPAGTVLFTSRAGIGSTAILGKEACTNQGFQSIVPKENLDTYFIYSRSHELKRYGEITGAGSTFVEVSGKQMAKMPILIPEIEEQREIGNFFSNLDQTIAFHQRKLELMKQMKKGLLQKIFCQELRFEGFDDNWSFHELKEAVNVNSGRDYKHFSVGKIPVYGTGGYMLSVNDKLSDFDSIGIGRKGSIDKPQYLKAPFWTVDTLFFLTPKAGYDIDFLFTLAQQINWKKLDESTGVPSLSKLNIEKVQGYFPSLK